MAKKSILLVDDEAIIRHTLGRDLKEAGYDVKAVENGAQAVAALTETYYDLIVTDLLMEGLDGIQVLKETKKINPEICVMILTGFGDMTSAIDALRLGADDYILKPYDFAEIALRIVRCLEKQKLMKKIKLYEDILPICSVCKKIRNDTGQEPGKGKWMTLERYINRKTGIKMSHSYCPECEKKALDEIDLVFPEKKEKH